MIKTWIVLLWIASSAQAAPAGKCLETRGILDIGSGATKMKVARVDTCLQKVVKILADDSIKVAYSADLKKSADLKFSADIQAQGLKAIETLIAKGDREKPTRWFGFATSAFRVAKNGPEVLGEYSKKTKAKLQVISQDQEGVLGFIAGVQAAQAPMDQAPTDQVVVWDIGGGSQQFAYRSHGKVKVVKLENLASEKFKERVMTEVKNEKGVKTPNPIGVKNLAASLEIAKHFADGVKFPFVPKQVIGIGGVHAKSFEKTLKGKSPYTIADLAKAARKNATKTDAELKDDYADTQVTNLILVQGMMEKLKFKSITVSKFGGAEGALVNPEYWK